MREINLRVLSKNKEKLAKEKYKIKYMIFRKIMINRVKNNHK